MGLVVHSYGQHSEECLNKTILYVTLTALICSGSLLADTFVFSGSVPDGAVNAKATITPGTNSVTVVVTSLLVNPTSDGQNLSGILFTLSGSPVGLSLFSAAGNLITINNHVGTPDLVDTIDHWGTSLAGSTICLETAGTCAVGGKPHDLIMASGSYSNANSSIEQHNPQIKDTGTFILHFTGGVNADTTITGVQFAFGTTPTIKDGSPCTAGTVNCQAPLAPVPEPSSVMLLSTTGLGIAFALRRRFSKPA